MTMPKKSAGILMYRLRKEVLEVLLVHPGGPFWTKKDIGSWSIPKGEYTDTEDPFTVAKREFEEETGFQVDGDFTPLRPLKQPSGKVVSAWAVEGDCDASKTKSNTFLIASVVAANVLVIGGAVLLLAKGSSASVASAKAMQTTPKVEEFNVEETKQ